MIATLKNALLSVKLVIAVLALGLVVAQPALAYDPADFNPYEDIEDHIRDLVDNSGLVHPAFSSGGTAIGQSHEGRDIHCFRITAESNDPDDPLLPRAFLTGGEHAREWLGVTQTLNLAEWLINEYGSDADVTNIVDQMVIYVIPVMNPDGYAHSWGSDRFWSKNRTPGSTCDGIALSTNWPYLWTDVDSPTSGASSNECARTYHGPGIGSPATHDYAAETLAISDYLQLVGGPHAHLNFQAFGNMILWNGMRGGQSAPHSYLAASMASLVKAASNKDYGLRQRWDWGPGSAYSGSMGDSVRDEYGTISLDIVLPDASYGFVPPASEIQPTAQEWESALVFFLLELQVSTQQSFDMDGDGTIDANDEVLLYHWLASGRTLDELQSFAAPCGTASTVRDYVDCVQANLNSIPPPTGSPTSGCTFVRGDTDHDWDVDVDDLVSLVEYLDAGGTTYNLDALDVNDDGVLDGSDATQLSEYLFPQTTPADPLPDPFPLAGLDPTYPDGLADECDPIIDLGSRAEFLEYLCETDSSGGGGGYCWLSNSPRQIAENPEGEPDPSGVGPGGYNPWGILPPGSDADGDGYVDHPDWIDIFLVSEVQNYVFPPTYNALHPTGWISQTPGFVSGSMPPELAFTAQGSADCFGYLCPLVEDQYSNASGRFNFPASPLDVVQAGVEFDENWETTATYRRGSTDRCTVTGYSKHSYTDKATGLVDLGNGEVRFGQSYLHLKGRGLDYDFSFQYCSRPRGVGISGRMGLNVDHYYFQRLQPWFGCDVLGSSGFIRIVEGQAEFYALDEDDVYLQVNEGYNRLKVVRSGGDAVSAVVRTPGGLMFSYYALRDDANATALQKARSGLLQKIIDPHGNQITLHYDAATHELDYIIDTLGRKIDYTYVGGQLTQVTSVPDHRTVTFTYSKPSVSGSGLPNAGSWPDNAESYAGGDVLLASVTGPAVSTVANSPGTPAQPHTGQRMLFEYHSHFILDGVTAYASSYDGFAGTGQVLGEMILPLLTMISVDSSVSSPDPYIKFRYGSSGRVSKAIYGDLTAWQQAESQLNAADCDTTTGGSGGGSGFPVLDTLKKMSGSSTTFMYQEYPYHGPCLENGLPQTYLEGSPPTVLTHMISSGGGVETVSFDQAGAVQQVVSHEGVVFGGVGNLNNYAATTDANTGSWASLFGSDIPCHNYCKYVTTYTRNEKGQPTLTVFPNGNARAVRYDPVVGGVIEERFYQHVEAEMNRIVSTLHSNEVGITRYELSDGYFVGKKQVFEPLFGRVLQTWDPRHPELLDSSVTWPDHSYSSMDPYSLTTRHYVDYEGLTPLDDVSHGLVQLWTAFDLPVPGESPYFFPAGTFPTEVTPAPYGNIVATHYPTATLPDGTDSGEIWDVREYNDGGLLNWEANAEGVVTAYTYYDASNPGSAGQSFSPEPDPYPPVFTHIGKWDDARGGYLASMTEDASSPVVDRGTIREAPLVGAGRTTTFSYDTYGNEVSVTDPLLRTTTTTYNEINQPVESTDALGFKTYWHYDGLNKMTLELREYGATDFSGAKVAGVDVVVPNDDQGTPQEQRLVPMYLATAFKYDKSGSLVAKSETYSDAAGAIYDQSGDPLPHVLANSITWLYFYNLDHKLIQTVEPNGNVSQHFYYDRGEKWFDAVGVVDAPTMEPPLYLGGPLFPDPADGKYADGDYPLPVELTVGSATLDSWAPGTETRFRAFGYDHNGNLSCEVDAAQQGHPSTTYRTDADYTVHYYDRWDRLERTVQHNANDFSGPSGDYPPGTQEILFYDPAGNVVRKDVVGDVLSTNPSTAASWTDVVAELEVKELATTQYRYDELQRKVQTETEIFDLGGTATGHLATTQQFLDRLGKTTKAVDAEGREAHSRYDRLGRLIRTASPEADNHQGGGDEYARAWHTMGNYHDVADRLIELRSTERDRYGQVLDKYYTITTYDDLDRPVAVEDHIGQTVRSRYDSRGLLVEAQDARDQTTTSGSRTTADGQSHPVETNDTGNSSFSVYDVFGRVTEQRVDMREDGFGDAPLVQLNGTPGRVHTLLNDPQDKITTHGQSIRTRTLYDRKGNVIARQDDNGRETRYDYNQHDQVVLVTHPDATTDTYAYDGDGLQISHIDGNGTEVVSSYDIGHRLVHRLVTSVSPDVEWSNSTQDFVYDGMGRIVWSRDENDPTTGDDDHTTARLYDSLGRVRWEYLDLNDGVESRYDNVGNKTNLLYPSGLNIGAAFDTMNRVAAVNKDSNPWITYQMAGRARLLGRSVLTSSPVETSVEYDELGRLSATDHRVQGNLIRRFVEHYNRSNHRTCEVRTPGGRVDSWFYDSASRLYLEVEADTACPNGPGGTTQGTGVVTEYWLDGVGNWMATRESDPQAGDEEHRNTINDRNAYTDLAGEPYSHDFAGNRTAHDNRQYIYDGLHRLIKVVDATVTVTYEYFADHRRARKEIAGTDEVTYFYDGDRLIERHTAGSVSQAYVYGSGRHRVLSYYDYDLGEDFVLVEDAQGSTSGLLSSSGNLVESYEYNAYGVVSFYDDQGQDLPASIVGNDFLYVGYLYEPEVNHYWLKFRVYDPASGKFLTIDPIGVWSDRANWGSGYGYAGFNPAMFQDLLGLETIPCDRAFDPGFSSTNTDQKYSAGARGGFEEIEDPQVADHKFNEINLMQEVFEGNVKRNVRSLAGFGAEAGASVAPGVDWAIACNDWRNGNYLAAGCGVIGELPFGDFFDTTLKRWARGSDDFAEVTFRKVDTGDAPNGGERTVYHYTDEAGAKGISETGVIKPDSKGRVYVTEDKVKPENANNELFMGQGGTKGTHVAEIKLKDDVPLTPGTQPNELIHEGSIRDPRHGTINVKENDN